jgi:hypothetical protein
MLTLPVPLDDVQLERAQLVDRRLRSRVPALREPVAATWELHHRLLHDQGRPWLLCPVELDPLRNRRGGYPLPAEAEATLRGLADAGATFDQIAIAHELDPASPALARLGDVPPEGLALTPRTAARALGRTPAPEESVEAARRIDERVRKAGRVVRKVGEGVAVAAVALPIAALASDPIVFGVVGIHGVPAPGKPALYYPLAAWLW